MSVRPQAQVRHVYEFGPFVLDPHDTTRLRLMKDGQRWPIQDKQFQLLCILVINYGHAVKCEQLIRDVWDEDPDPQDKTHHDSGLRKLHTQIKRLRHVIGETEDTKIENRHGGYAFVGTVVEKISKKPPYGTLEDFTFSWIFFSPECRKTKVLFGLGALGSLFYLTQFLLKKLFIEQYEPWPDPRLVLSLVQFVVIALALKASFAIFDREERIFPSLQGEDRKMMKLSGYDNAREWKIAKKSARKSVRHFFYYWKLLLVAWGLLWLIMIGKFSNPPAPASAFSIWATLFDIGSTLFNNCNSVAIALCFMVLNHPTISPRNVSNTHLLGLRRKLEKWGGIAIVGFALAECFLLYIKPKGWLPIDPSRNYLWGPDVISGLIGGVCLALFVGRIQSRFLGSSTWLPAALYLYVAIQSLYVAIPETRTGGALLIVAALVLKCLLFLYLAWLFKSGRFLFYFVRVRTLYDKANPEWKDFFLNLGRK